MKAVSPEEKTQCLADQASHGTIFWIKKLWSVLTKAGDHDWENLEKDLRLLIDGNYVKLLSLHCKSDEVIKELQSVFHEKKEPHEPHDNEKKKEEVTENGASKTTQPRLQNITT